ncbi:LysM domain-containing protein [uncultured Cetobacterium sp.]|uniref:LysM peptidoglycan-binding domain-containing protein n=1 Tax=uncultured Cetobacterium sp. TaxID=527638 RepID=UPI002636BB2B|nr:LysM domain-containing protein [uncultured Cetobacterium sp.]
MKKNFILAFLLLFGFLKGEDLEFQIKEVDENLVYINILPKELTEEEKLMFHIVKNGETLNFISKLYKINLKDLEFINKIENANEIYVGQKLRLK